MVTELRLAMTVTDFDTAVAFYRDALGLPVAESWDGPDGRGMALDAGRAVLELLDPTHARFVDQIEVGRPVSGPIRLALRVADSSAMASVLASAGAEVVAPPTVTPWNHRNARLVAPDGMQLTLFSEVES
jgi:catechol 2,3-dioxygenase-like lactoylglutathione lyase family enzyme